MQINGPSQIVFPDGSAQQSLALTTSGTTGTVGFSVTEIPAQVASVRLSATASPLAVGAALTPAQAGALVVTRTASGGTGYGPTIDKSAIVGVRSRVYATGTAAPAFTTGDSTAVTACKNGNYFIPDFPTGGSGTFTVDMLFDIGTAITLGKVVDTLLSLGYTTATSDQWTGVSATTLVSSDGTTISVLNALTITADSTNPFNQKKLNATVTGALSGRWVGVRLTAVSPSRYPCVFGGLGVQASTGSGSTFTPLPSPVYFGVTATDSGSGSGALIDQSSIVGVRTRVFASGTTAPSFTTGDANAVTACKDGNYFIPGLPTSGTGTYTIDVLVDIGTAITLASVADTKASLGYTTATTDQWTGVTANAIASSDGTTLSVLNALAITADSASPLNQKKLNATVSGAPTGRWVGFRLLGVSPSRYPCVFAALGVHPASGSGSSATYRVPIGDTSTDFGSTPPPTGNPVVYGDPGTRFPLGIYLPSPAASYALTIPVGLSLVVRSTSPTTITVGSAYSLTSATGPFAPTQTAGGASSVSLQIVGSGKSFDGTNLNLSAGTYLASPALGLSFASSSDASKSQTPPAFTLSFKGVIPTDKNVIAAVYEYGQGGIVLLGNWATNNVIVRIERDGTVEEFESASVFSNTAVEDVAVRYVDNASGAGGTISFLRAGTQVGTAQTTTIKPRVVPDAPLESNALSGNTAGGGALKVQKLGVTVDLPSQSESFTPVSAGNVTATQLQNLYVDALAVMAPQSARTVTYQPTGGSVQALDVVIGPLTVPAGAPYRAVLEDWSSGSAVSHANVLVMTRPVRQNCVFEDAQLGAVPPWIECLPQGAVPVIGGIAYYCEAVRIGSYATFQFGYDWTTVTMPNNPFGDPSGKNSYMVPHKWRIEDSSGNLLGKVERPDGGPLNGTDIPRIFAGSYDGNGVAITNATDRWYPHGTVRAAVIWRSATPTAQSQSFINANLPRYDITVPYASHTHFSNNGGDMRLWSDGQANGFGNTRVMPWQPTTYAALVPQAGVTQDPYKASLYADVSLASVASTWLKYTPFNQAGRSPVTGPGGARDDRAGIAEPVAQYMYDVTATRPHDGTPFAAIALDYCSSYASDPYHCFEGGRCVPLFKGPNANRTITLRNHYYGAGDGATPPERAYYIQGGQPYVFATQYSPLRVTVPYAGSAADKPYFGTNEIDSLHAHQFPHWGSLLWKTPEFAFLGHKLWDQTRLYLNVIINESSAQRWAVRDGAWSFLHAALAWKTASANSDRLYSRAEVMAFAVADFEAFSDMHKTATPGFDHPPANLFTGGAIDPVKVAYAGASKFGIIIPINDDYGQHDFYAGYWLSALGIGEKLGFNAALRSASAKAGAVLDWLIAQHRKRIVGRINSAPRANLADNNYLFVLWKTASINAASGNVASLPQTFAAVATQNGNAPSWDYSTANGVTDIRDGQATDQLLAGPSILKNQLAQTGTDLDSALTTVTGWRNQKKSEQLALGSNAGQSWFRYLNAMNNPAIS